MFQTKNDLPEEVRAKAVELLSARLADHRPATPYGPTPPPGDKLLQDHYPAGSPSACRFTDEARITR
jgi:hypothetical protein